MTNFDNFKQKIFNIINNMNDEELTHFLLNGENATLDKAKDIKILHNEYSNNKCSNCKMNNKQDKNGNDICKGDCDKYCSWLKRANKMLLKNI